MCSQNCEKRLSASSRLSVCLSVCLSVRMQQLGSQWTDFYEILYLSIFRKSIDKIQISLKSYKNNTYFTWRPIYIYESILLRMRNALPKRCTENQTHILCSITFSPKSYRLWDNVEIKKVKPNSEGRNEQRTSGTARLYCSWLAEFRKLRYIILSLSTQTP